MKTLAALLLAIGAGTGVAACGSADAGPAQRSDVTVAAAHNRAGQSSSRARDGYDAFGDYDDDDDYYHDGSHSDGDKDDRATPEDRDNDADSGAGSYYDSDDRSVRDYGRPAREADRRSIVALVKLYAAVATTGDGDRGCSLISKQLTRAYPQVLGESGPRYLHGLHSCGAIVSKMFRVNHAQLAAYSQRLQVTGVRVRDRIGLAILAFRGLPGRYLEAIREGRSWRMYSPLALELP